MAQPSHIKAPTRFELVYPSAQNGSTKPTTRRKGVKHVTTQIRSQITPQLAQAYNKTQQELGKSPEMATQVWDDALTQLQGIDFSNPTRSEFYEAHAAVSVLMQVLVAVAGRTNGFNKQ